MADGFERRVLLVTYDLPSAEHSYWNQLLRHELGPQGGDWIRVQRSIILVRTYSSPADFTAKACAWRGEDAGHHMLAIDVTNTEYGGRAKPEVWEWLRAARFNARRQRPNSDEIAQTTEAP